MGLRSWWRDRRKAKPCPHLTYPHSNSENVYVSGDFLRYKTHRKVVTDCVEKDQMLRRCTAKCGEYFWSTFDTRFIVTDAKAKELKETA